MTGTKKNNQISGKMVQGNKGGDHKCLYDPLPCGVLM